MNSKERVLAAFSNQVPDRVPINYSANAGIDRRLKSHFGLKANDDEGLRNLLGVDFRSVTAPYVGPCRHHALSPDIAVDEWGIRRRWVEHETGGYWDYCDFPLRDADEQAVADWPLPRPDDFDTSGVFDQCCRFESCAITGSGGYGDIINGNGMGCCAAWNRPS